MAAAAVEVPDVGCFDEWRAGPPGLGSAATRRRRQGRIGARLFARRSGKVTTSWRCMCDDVVVQLFWRGMCTETGEHGSKYLLGQQQLEESAELLLRIVRGQQGGCDNDTAAEFLSESISRSPESISGGLFTASGDVERNGSPGSTSGGPFSTKGDVAGNAGSPENISGGLLFAKGDVESIDGSPERISDGLFTARGDEEGDGSPGSISGGFVSAKGDAEGKDGSPECISGGRFSERGDVEGDGSPGSVSGGLFSTKGDVECKDGSPESISGGRISARGDV